MKVLVAHDVPGTKEGGMTRIMRLIHAQLATRGYHTEYLHAEDVVASPLVRRAAFPRAVFKRAQSDARKGTPYDILNIHEPSAVAASLNRRTLGNARIVVTTHGVEQRAWELALEEARLGREGPRLKTRVVYPLTSLWQSRYGLTHADHVLCLNHEDQQFLERRFGISHERITVIVPGADTLYADLAATRDYAGQRRLLFAGTWRKNKGIEDLVPAFEELVQRRPDTELIVLGAGVPADVVTAAFSECARPHITCIVSRSETETARAFASADLFILPSLFEGTPLTLVEAMMSGLPIVTTAVCGMKDVIEDGRNGLLVPIRSPKQLVGAVENLMTSRERRAALGSTARRDALTHYTWARAADRVERAYEVVTGGVRSRGPVGPLDQAAVA